MISVRIVTAQGSLQLLNVLSVLEHQNQEEGLSPQNYEDILVLGGYATGDSVGQQLTETCLNIAKVWSFKKVIFFDADDLFGSLGGNFYACTSHLLKLMGLDVCVDSITEVYVSRNWQVFNEAVLFAFASARKICYGDGLGGLDLFSTVWIKKAYNPDGLLPVDEAYLIAPSSHSEGIDCFSLVKRLVIVNGEYFKSIVSQASKLVPRLAKHCAELGEFKSGIDLLLTSTYHQSGLTKSIESELELYLDNLKAYDLISKERPIVIKGHPRDIYDLPKMLMSHLVMRGYSAHVTKFASVPVELYTPFVDFVNIFAGLSGSVIPLAYMTGSEIVYGYGETLLRKVLLTKCEVFLRGQRMLACGALQAVEGRFVPIGISDFLHQDRPYPQSPLRLRSCTTNAEVAEYDLLKLINLRAAIKYEPKCADSYIRLAKHFRKTGNLVSEYRIQELVGSLIEGRKVEASGNFAFTTQSQFRKPDFLFPEDVKPN